MGREWVMGRIRGRGNSGREEGEVEGKELESGGRLGGEGSAE